MKLYISPNYYRGADLGNGGGIRRVIDAQREYFATSLVSTVEAADTVAIHAGSMVKLRTDQKVIAHCHGLLWNKYNWNGQERDTNSQVAHAIHVSDFVTAPTEWVANAIRHATNRSVDVVPHAVDSSWVPGKTNGNYVLWNKSRIDKVCDPEPVYDVARMLPDIKFKMTVGRGTSNIEITGLTPYDDKTPVQNAGVYLATAQETFGIGILEALACGVPVVGWNWGGATDILPKEWLAREGDYDHLARLILWALENRSKLGEWCQSIAAKYTWPKIMQQYEEIYERSIGYEKRVSVIIRNYNTGEFLQEAIDSVVAQCDLDDEIFVVDDYSSDNSVEIAKSNGIRFERPDHNLGLSGILNYAMSKAHGKYILHLDADNKLGPRAIDQLVAGLESDREIDIAYGRIEWSTPIRSDWPPSEFNIDRQLSHKNQIPCTSMYRRKVFDVVGPYRERCKVAEDADFWCRAAVLGFKVKQVTTAKVLWYRIREGSTSQTVKDWPWEKWYAKTNIGHSCEPVLVSAIIPVGPGHEKYLQDALDSLYMQSFRNWECIIVNDTGVPLPWTPVWARVLQTNGELGPSISRNMGLDKAKGGLWLALDADDYLVDQNALLKMVTKWQQNKQHYIYTDYYRSDLEAPRKVADYACDVLLHQMPHILTGLYPVLRDVRFDPEIELGEDWDFALQMTTHGYCGVHLAEPLSKYRVESGTRRKAFDSDNRQELNEKWSETIMACSKCSQRAKELTMNPPAIPQGGNDVVLVRYIGTEPKRYFIGKQSSHTYSFGATPGLMEKYVLKVDVDGFTARPDKFMVTV